MNIKETFAQAITEILIKQGAIKSQEGQALIKGFKESEKEDFEDFILEEGLVSQDTYLKALSEYYQVPMFEVLGFFFDTLLLHKFPKDVMLRNAFIPLAVDDDEETLAVVANEPDNEDLLLIIGEYVSYDVQFRVGLKREICDAVKEYYEPSVTEEATDVDIREEHRLERDEHRLEDEEEMVPYEEEE